MSPDVVVHRDTMSNGLVELPERERQVVAIIMVAAPCYPKVTDDHEEFAEASELHDLREKMLLMLRMAAGSGVTKLVLGAMECGACGYPSRAVVKEMKMGLEREEFGEVVFAVYAAGKVGEKNLEVFKEGFGSV
jgi:uncharacterized protein (TIGR02452 family)